MTSKPNSSTLPIVIGILAFILCTLPLTLAAYRASDFNWRPPFTTVNEDPSVTIFLDTSNAMNRMAYAYIDSKNAPGESDFTPYGSLYSSTGDYSLGYFDSTKKYSYNPTQQYFEVNSTGDWSGKYLNYATMHRIDLMKIILAGGNETKALDGSRCFLVTPTDDIDRGVEFNGTITGVIPNFGPYPIYLRIRQFSSELEICTQKTNGDYVKKPGTTSYLLRVKSDKVFSNNVLDKFGPKSRFALFGFFPGDKNGNEHKGGKALAYMTENATDNLKAIINALIPSGRAPLAEGLYTVIGWIQQVNAESQTNGPKYNADSYSSGMNTKYDPYYFSKYGRSIECTQQNILIITPGEVRQDGSIPNEVTNYPPTLKNSDLNVYDARDKKIAELFNVSYFGHVNIKSDGSGSGDLRASGSTALADKQLVNTYIVSAFGKRKLALKHAAIFGGFEDTRYNDKAPDRMPSPDPIAKSTIPYSPEYNNDDNPENPDNFFEGESGPELEAAINLAFEAATSGKLSGTAAAVTSQTRSGEGAVYQALFFPPTNATEIFGAPWSGQVHALFVDSQGNMREDTNDNRRLDADTVTSSSITYNDRIILFDDFGKVYAKSNNSTEAGEVNTQAVNYLWSSTPWLNQISSMNIVTNRDYKSYTDNRYLFTFADKNNNMVNDDITLYDNEVKPFEFDGSCDVTSLSSFCSYLTLFESTPGQIGAPTGNSSFSDSDVMLKLAERQIEYIRGLDQSNTFSVGGKTLLDPIRSRVDITGTVWRLGDIVYSSPTIVGAPSENYNILYRDITYNEFFKKYKDRRQMIYVGANDGMLHAFNGGFYNRDTKGFELSYKTGSDKEVEYPLGMEMWGYVPYNLLPHLRWLMNPEYGGKIHVPYMDLKPRIFDARVFEYDTPTKNSTHPNGWGTILVAGMRFGGGAIEADINKNNQYDPGSDREMSSAYVIMDITNPEDKPTLLGEVRMPNLGFTTCYPTIMPMATRNSNSTSDNKNNWFLVFGSGPADSNGKAQAIAPNDRRDPATSTQPGHLYILDLKALVQQKTIRTLTPESTDKSSFQNGNHAFATTENPSFIGDPVAVDVDFGSRNDSAEFKTDFLYYGTVSGDETTPTGTMRRIITNNENSNSTVYWTRNATLINAQMPIPAAPNVAMDNNKNLWVYFGSGRYYNRGDIALSKHMSFLGIKENAYNGTTGSVNLNPSIISASNLYNSTAIELTSGYCPGAAYNSDCVGVYKSGSALTGGWTTLLEEVDATPGWRHDFTNVTPQWERVLGQPAVFGGAVLFTGYLPASNICSPEGTSNLYALYYKTGTAYFEPILRGGFDKSTPLGKGLSITPSIHVGEKGSTAFIQTSTGAIKTIEIVPPINVKPGVLFWRKNVD